MKARRSRAFALLAAALACGALAASSVSGRVAEVEEQVGGLEPVVVARSRIPAGTKLDPGRIARLLTVRKVPRRFLPSDALAAPGQARDATLAVELPSGSYITAAALGGGESAPEGEGPPLRLGERAVEVAVAGSDSLASVPGSRVDVLVTSERRSFVALEDAELLELRAGAATETAGNGGGGSGASVPSATAVLRVTARQAVYLTAAQSFAREVRLLARPPGDRRSVGAAAVSAGEL
ncbi:MAG: hypothetical protein H0V29_09910 [Thermoleophilaceae bacterium]|nr:hypothetical protein [Thermoleophilaceae bacterium]